MNDLEPMLPTEPIEEEPEIDTGFEADMLSRIQQDFGNAKQFMRPFHQRIIDKYRLYYNSLDYADLSKRKRLPDSFFQEQIDSFVSDAMDKTFYNNRPCQAMPTPGTPKEDADAKQDFMDWLDKKDGVYLKLEQSYRNAALCGYCVGKVDYEEWTKSIQEPQNIPVGEPDPETGEQAFQSIMVPREIVDFKGASVKIIDPLDLFVVEQKRAIRDQFPIMIRSYMTKDDLRSLPGTFDVDDIKVEESGAVYDELTKQKREMLGLSVTGKAAEQNREVSCVEWQGMVDSAKLAEWRQAKFGEDSGNVNSGKTWAIAIMANDSKIVRLEKSPYPFSGPNIRVGVIRKTDGEIISIGLGDMLYGIASALDIANGMWMTHFRLAINRQHVVNTTQLTHTGEIKVNDPASILEVTDDVNKVHKVLDQPAVAQDIYNAIEMLRQRGKDATGIQNLQMGKSDPNASTATVGSIIANQSSLRMRNYIRCLEETFVEELYDLRNQINIAAVDVPFAVSVLGPSGATWRTVTPGQVRASVQFVCLGSSRETNRAVITQQMMQMADPCALAEKAGFPTRWDIMLRDLAENGFGWKRIQTEDLWPTLTCEDAGIDVKTILLQKFLAVMGAQIAPPVPPGTENQGGGGESATAPGGPQQVGPQSANEQDVLGGLANMNMPAQIGVQ